MQQERELELHARISALQVSVVAILEVLRQQQPNSYQPVIDCLNQTAQLAGNQTMAFAIHEILALLAQAQEATQQ